MFATTMIVTIKVKIWSATDKEKLSEATQKSLFDYEQMLKNHNAILKSRKIEFVE